MSTLARWTDNLQFLSTQETCPRQKKRIIQNVSTLLAIMPKSLREVRDDDVLVGEFTD